MPGWGHILEFNVPPSINGIPQIASPNDQWDVSGVSAHGGSVYPSDNDWAILNVPSKYFGNLIWKYPWEVQEATIDIRQDFVDGTNMRVSGYGCTNTPNLQLNFTLSTSTGTGIRHTQYGEFIRFVVDVSGGNSGGPIIDTQTNCAVGIVVGGGCSGLEYNTGLSFYKENFWNAMEGNKRLTRVTQVDENNQPFPTSVKYHWWSNNQFVEKNNSEIIKLNLNTNEYLRANQSLIDNKKYHQWIGKNDYINHTSFYIDYDLSSQLFAKFIPATKSLTIQNSASEFNTILAGNVVIFDPWIIDEYDSKGAKNRGLNAVGHSFSSPFIISEYPEHQGVFLNQGYNPVTQTWTPPYYQVRTNSFEDISLTNTGVATGRNHRFYFRNWSADPVGSAEFQYPNVYYTPVVFRNSGATVQANLKGTQLSNNSNAYNSNSQRKSIRTPDNSLFNIYESLGTVWMENSTDNGQTWSFLNNAYPFGTYPASNAAIDYFPWSGYSYVAGVYYINGEALKLKVLRSNNTLVYNANLPWDVGVTSPAIPSIAVTGDRILIVSTGGIYQQAGLVYFYGTVQQSPFSISWIIESEMLPGTNAQSISPTIVADKNSTTPTFHIAWQEGANIKYRRLTETGGNISFSTVENITSSSPYPNNYDPSISLANGSPVISWTADNGPSIEKIVAVQKEQTKFEKRAVIRKGPVWGDYQVAGNNVNYTNNNSVTSSQEKTVIVWSEGTTPQSKWMKRTGGWYSTPVNLSHSGIQTQVISGSDYNSMTSIVFNNNQAPYYFIKTSTDFNIEESDGGGELGKVTLASDSTVTFGRAGIVNINGVSFVFNTGDVLWGDSIISFIEKPDSIICSTPAELNQYTRTENFQLNGSSQFYFSNMYYVLNKELAATSMNETQNVNFKVQLVNTSTNEIAGVFDDITFDKNNLDKYANISYQVNCSGIEAGEYFLRLVTSVNTEAVYTLANLMNNSEELEKKQYTEINYSGTELPDSYDLAQNYPNPFNPTTVISWQSPVDSRQTIKVYDILGKEVITLVDEFKAAGSYSVKFDGSNLASGVYIYRINTGDFVASKKMMLIK